MGARDPQQAFETGGVIEEVSELLARPFTEDEWQEFVAESMARQEATLNELATKLQGGFGTALTGKQRAVRFNYLAKSDTDIFSEDIVPENTGFLRLVILPEVKSFGETSNTSGVLSTTISNGEEVVEGNLNSSTAVEAGNIYAFDVPVSPDFAYNYQLDTTLEVPYAVVVEYWGE